MWFQFGRKRSIKPIRDGRQERRKCPSCGEDTTFTEVTVEKTYTAYVVVDLFNTESTAFRCMACGEVMDLESTLAPNLSEREKQAQAQAQAQAEAERARRQAKDAADRKRTPHQPLPALPVPPPPGGARAVLPPILLEHRVAHAHALLGPAAVSRNRVPLGFC